MAAYPSYAILLPSSKDEESGIEDDFSEAGTQHSRTFHSQSYFRFRLRHNLTLAQWKSLRDTTYGADKRATHTLSYLTESPVVTYTVKFTSAPRVVTNHGNDRYTVEVNLRGTKD